MRRKLILAVLLFALACAGSVFAQEKNGGDKNTISATLVCLRYERAFNNVFSVGAEAGMFLFTLQPSGGLNGWEVDGFARLYPFSGVFYLETGVGYANMKDDDDDYSGIFIKPILGWKADIGQPGGWIMDFGLGFGLTAGASAGSMLSLAGGLAFGYMF
ncbi:MAG: hypothetical protein LBC67_02455 [Spirochaetales bacterium]|jgi:hypothetical protein|nr:hypothetical protein [Spirochaetales bacterium]